MFRKIFFIVLTLATVAAICGTLYLYVPASGDKPLPVLAQIGDFELTNQDAQTFSRKDVQDKVWVASFVFTSCAGPCPLLTKRVGEIARDTANVSEARFVSISVDPEYDTPAVLKNYGQKYNADFSRWNFLTGKRDDIAKLMTDDFKLGYAEDIMFHSDRLVLVDRQGRVRGYYSGGEPNAYKKLRDDLAMLVNEK